MVPWKHPRDSAGSGSTVQFIHKRTFGPQHDYNGSENFEKFEKIKCIPSAAIECNFIITIKFFNDMS